MMGAVLYCFYYQLTPRMTYDILASPESIQKAAAGLSSRNVTVHIVNNREEALEKVKSLIPDGAEVMTGSSTTLEQIGFVDLLKSGKHPWKNLKDAIVTEKDPAKQGILRKRATLSDYFLGSVHAVTESGETVTASNSGSQLPSYAFSSDNVIWVVGAQKIVPDLEAGMKRVREYVFPLEDQHMKSLGYPGSNISKMFIFEKEIMPSRKIQMVLVKEALGF